LIFEKFIFGVVYIYTDVNISIPIECLSQTTETFRDYYLIFQWENIDSMVPEKKEIW
jgi:hypothetical protein